MARKTKDAAPSEEAIFPLPEGHYFYTPNQSPRAHDGSAPGEGEFVSTIQEMVGAGVTGLFDEQTRDAVKGALRDKGVPTSGFVDSHAWYSLAVVEPAGETDEEPEPHQDGEPAGDDE